MKPEETAFGRLQKKVKNLQSALEYIAVQVPNTPWGKIAKLALEGKFEPTLHEGAKDGYGG